MSPPADTSTPIANRAREHAPVVWMLGKVQSGKSSIVRALTQADDAEIGTGFKACTRTARVFDFPEDVPILRFLDTRGLGEVDYDPAADLAFCEARAHLVLAVVKALDVQQQSLLDVMAAVRKRHPDWPIVVAQTCLHEAYPPGGGHLLPYPFAAEPPAVGIPEPLQRALAHQRTLFAKLPGSGGISFVPIDFTHAADGLAPVDYGRTALIDALIAAAPAAVRMALAELPHAPGAKRTADAHILGYALAAGAGDAFPVAGAIVVPVVQGAMLHQLAKLYGVTWGRRDYAEFAGALGAGTLVRTAAGFGVRQLVKLVPVYGQTAGAAAAAVASFAATYALGKAARLFLARRQQGVSAEELSKVYRETLKDAFVLARERNFGSDAKGPAA